MRVTLRLPAPNSQSRTRTCLLTVQPLSRLTGLHPLLQPTSFARSISLRVHSTGSSETCAGCNGQSARRWVPSEQWCRASATKSRVIGRLAVMRGMHRSVFTFLCTVSLGAGCTRTRSERLYWLPQGHLPRLSYAWRTRCMATSSCRSGTRCAVRASSLIARSGRP